MKKLQLLALSMLLSTSMIMQSKNTTRIVNSDGTVTTETCKGNTCTVRENFNKSKCKSNSCLRHYRSQAVEQPLVVERPYIIEEEIMPTRTVTEYRTERPVVTTTERTTVIDNDIL